MDVHGLPPGARPVAENTHDPRALPTRPGALSAGRVGRALGEWQRSELRLARSFAECRGLPREQLEDLYQETVLILLGRPYHDEEHLRNALRWGIKHRALHLHRDERRRGEILQQRAPELQLAAERREEERTPELAALLAQDRLVVSEFLTELTELERRVFWLAAEGMRYRAIAPILGVGVNEARKASRACERKRERFQLLYDTGRLCGFRSHTIHALQAGQGASEELAQGAFAHLEGCAHCRTEHKTNARRLRRSFQGQAAALLPIPALAGRLGWLARLNLRARTVHQRLPYSSPPGTSGAREGAVAMLAGGGAAAKLAAAAATVAVLAGGTIGATHALQRNRPRHHHNAGRSASTPGQAASAPSVPAPGTAASTSISTAPRDSSPAGSARRSSSAPRQPGGFAFLGVPSSTTPRETERARAASATPRQEEHPAQRGEERTGGTGGPFSP